MFTVNIIHPKYWLSLTSLLLWSALCSNNFSSPSETTKGVVKELDEKHTSFLYVQGHHRRRSRGKRPMSSITVNSRTVRASSVSASAVLSLHKSQMVCKQERGNSEKGTKLVHHLATCTPMPPPLFWTRSKAPAEARPRADSSSS